MCFGTRLKRDTEGFAIIKVMSQIFRDVNLKEKRGNLSRPSLSEVNKYRSYVDKNLKDKNQDQTVTKFVTKIKQIPAKNLHWSATLGSVPFLGI